MHNTVNQICIELDALAKQIKATIPSDEPMAIAHNNWSFPGVTKSELAEFVESLLGEIREADIADLKGRDARVHDYLRRLQFLRSSTVPNIWGNPSGGVPPLLATLHFLRLVLAPLMDVDPADLSDRLGRLRSQVRAMESRLSGLSAKATPLEEMVGKIERAHVAADQLPVDLEALGEARQEVDKSRKATQQNEVLSNEAKRASESVRDELRKLREDGEKILELCRSAYAASTSVGLAAAFAERSQALSKSMWVWVGGLLGALTGRGYLGSTRLAEGSPHSDEAC